VGAIIFFTCVQLNMKQVIIWYNIIYYVLLRILLNSKVLESRQN